MEQQTIQSSETEPDVEAEADTEGDEEIVEHDLTVKEVDLARDQLEEGGAEQLLVVRKPLRNEVLTTRWEEQAKARFTPTKLSHHWIAGQSNHR